MTRANRWLDAHGLVATSHYVSDSTADQVAKLELLRMTETYTLERVEGWLGAIRKDFDNLQADVRRI